MKVLAVTSEIYPLVKTGGLADVAGALPSALAGLGVEVRTLVPGYPSVMSRLDGTTPAAKALNVLGVDCRLVQATVEGLKLIVLDAPALFDRPGGPYNGPDGKDHPDNWHRFAVLSMTAALVAGGALDDFTPDLVHAHDWQAAMAPAYLRFAKIDKPSVITIHNMAFQGQFPARIFSGLQLPPEAFSIDGVEYYGGVGFLKAGIQNASAVTTVSPTYAREITTPGFGMGLDGLINSRSADLHGIVNGIETGTWDPASDGRLEKTYTSRTLKGRAINRQATAKRFGLEDDNSPLFVVISRLTWQKGIDLLAEVTPDLVAAGARLAVLGTGDALLEGRFLELSAAFPGRVGAIIGYDENLAHLMQGGGDAILIPSRFEPCGLTQLYGLHYGCVPVVARTGGLADTVVHANTAALNAGVATGIVHAPDSASALRQAVLEAVSLYGDAKCWANMQRQGMKADVSWQRSAAAYAELYASLLN